MPSLKHKGISLGKGPLNVDTLPAALQRGRHDTMSPEVRPLGENYTEIDGGWRYAATLSKCLMM
jgi:hypothetical protein